MADEKHAGGRPSKLTPEIAELARDYIETYKTKYDHEMPSHVGLSIILKVNRSTLYEWSLKENSEFSNILDECMAAQQLVLFNKGLTNDFNASIVKLALGKHGYSDKIDNDHTTKGEKIENNFIIQPVNNG